MFNIIIFSEYIYVLCSKSNKISYVYTFQIIVCCVNVTTLLTHKYQYQRKNIELHHHRQLTPFRITSAEYNDSRLFKQKIYIYTNA